MKGECNYPGGCTKIIDKCNGCLNIEDSNFCKMYPNPLAKWRGGKCSGYNNIKHEIEKKEKKIKTGATKSHHIVSKYRRNESKRGR